MLSFIPQAGPMSATRIKLSIKLPFLYSVKKHSYLNYVVLFIWFITIWKYRSQHFVKVNEIYADCCCFISSLHSCLLIWAEARQIVPKCIYRQVIWNHLNIFLVSLYLLLLTYSIWTMSKRLSIIIESISSETRIKW